MLTETAASFDRWIRGSYREMNTELEELYFAQAERYNVTGIGDDIKERLKAEGCGFVTALLEEWQPEQGFEHSYQLLGCIGFYMAACRRHEITVPSRESTSPLVEASRLALLIGNAFKVAPRLATSHLADFNGAVDGVSRSFTTLHDERLFFDYNALCMFAYMRAADALRRVTPIGISHPLAHHLFETARVALEEVGRWSAALHDELDVERFFFCVRPYIKPHRVGDHVYRGGNAGDFAGINVVDLLTGLCAADDPVYARLLDDKYRFMMPVEQALLDQCLPRENFLDQFLAALEHQRQSPWYRHNLEAFLRVLDTHGRNAAQHHDQLVRKFIEVPSAWLPPEDLTQVTASGPPLPVLLRSLEILRDLRMATRRTDIRSRHQDIERLRASL